MGIGRLFSKIGRAVSSFFKNLARDPLKTLLFIASIALAAVTVGGWLALGLAAAELALIGAAVATFVIGFDINELYIALTIASFIVSSYNLLSAAAWQRGVFKLYEFTKMGQDTFEWLLNLSIEVRLAIVAVNAFVTISALTSVRDGVTLTQGAITAAGELATAAGGIVGAVAGGAASGLFSSLFSSSGGLLLVAAAIGAYLILSDRSGAGQGTTINLKESTT